MSVKQLIEAARNENPAEFEKLFENVIGEKLAQALAHFKRTIVAEQFNIVQEEGDDCDDENMDGSEDDKVKSKKDKADKEDED